MDIGKQQRVIVVQSLHFDEVIEREESRVERDRASDGRGSEGAEGPSDAPTLQTD